MKKIFSFLTAVLFAGSMMATTVSKTVEELANEKSFTNSAVCTPFDLDEVITVSTTAADANTGKYYSNGQQIRLYQSGNASITLTAVEGYTISSVTLTYASQNSGILNEAESGVAVPFENVQSATFTVGNSGTATNGQARITAFSVTYDAAGGEGGGEEPTMAYYVAGSMTNWGPMAAYKLAANPANEGEYMGEFTFAANDEFKVGYSDGTTIESTNYFPTGMDNNYVINEAGEYVVYFRPDGQGGEGWHYGFIYAAKKEAPVAPTTCAEAREAILALEDNTYLMDQAEISLTGYVTEIVTAYSSQYNNISFWMADAANGGQIIEAYRAACASEEDAPNVGDKVTVTGKMKKYVKNNVATPEFDAACTFEILEPAAPAANYFLVGTNNGWSGADYQLAANPAAAGEYMLDVTFAAADEFKVIGVVGEDTTWYPDGENNNYVINEAGDYAVYFRPDGQGGEGWHYGVIYAAKKEAPADPTNCAEAAAAALSVSANNELYNNGAVYTITGYVTSIKTAYSDQFHNISFWMADAVDGGEVLQAYRAACASEADAPVVGDKVAVTGTLTKYNTTPEFSAACTFEILEHAAPTADYFLVGTLNNWNGEGYQFAANPRTAGEYMLDVEFAAGDEFKVIGVLEGDTTWYPAQAGNCTINDEGLYTVYFRPDYQGGQDWYEGCIYNVKKEAPFVHQYEVAEAIAAGLADDTEIMVRGVVTKITFKGKNFAKYGSANIYVADATGAEGEFQFFNCYSFDADTFRMSDPEYDATSTQNEEFQMVADDNGNAIYVGDTIIAFGKYKLYNTTHELNTGCYIVDVIPGEGGGEETIGYDYEPTEASQFSVVIDSIKVEDYTADFGVVALGLEDAEGVYFASLEYLTSTYDEKVGIPAGTYQISNSEAEGTFYASPGGDEDYDYGCYFGVIDGEYYTPYYMVSGTVTIYADGSMLVNATSYFGSTIKLVYGNPVEAVENTKVADNKVIKFIEAGKVVIRKNGVKYNVVGQMMK